MEKLGLDGPNKQSFNLGTWHLSDALKYYCSISDRGKILFLHVRVD